MSATLAEVKKVNGPFQKAIKVKVADVSSPSSYSKDGEEKKFLSAAVTDGVTVMKLVCYDPSQFVRIRSGSTILLRNIIVREQTLIATKSSRLFLSGDIMVSEEKLLEGKRLLNPPVADFITIAEGLTSPSKKCLSIKGKLVQEDQEREVIVRNTPTRVKDIWIKDETGKAKVTLWREKCDTSVRPGDFVSITDIVTSTYRNETSFSITSKSSIQITEQPVTSSHIIVEGISFGEGSVELLTEEGLVVNASEAVVAAAFPHSTDLEQTLLEKLPISLKVSKKGSDVVNIEL